MRLKSVWISDYKNLRDFSLTFDGESFLDIFVGKNGTGKSNFFEALVEIFRHIFDSRNELDEISFDYEVTYEIERKDTTISRRNEVFTINGRERKTVGQTPVPDNVLVYYSGHNETISKTVQRYAKAFASRSQRWEADEARQFISIGSDYKELLLSVMLMQSKDCLARKYLCEKLMIEVSGKTATLTLRKPGFARVDVDVADPKTFLWGANGVAREFLDGLLECIRGDYTPGTIYNRETAEYEIPVDLKLFSEKFGGSSSSEVFRAFDNLKTLGMFGGLSILLRLANGDVAKVGDFSDGQFQSVYIFAISELFKDRSCITLLDEPDSFLHPEWQFGFLKQVVDIAGTQAAQTNHVLLSSHSASTISKSDETEIRTFEFADDGVQVTTRDKSSIIKSLSAGLITFSEKEARLNIFHHLKNTDGHVLMVEGVTDEMILETAWSKLNGRGYNRGFDIISAFACTTLGRLMRDDNLYQNHPNRTIFALFDWDEAYNEWNMGAQTSDLVQNDPRLCLTKKRINQPGYNMLLPVPNGLSCEAQVIDQVSGNHYGANSSLPIELLFRDVPGLEQHFELDPTRPGDCVRFRGNKVNFAKTVIPDLDAQHFEVFRPVFDFIQATT